MRLVEARIFQGVSWIRHGVLAPSWRDGKPDPADNLSFNSGAESQVCQARAVAGELLGVNPAHFTYMYQVHSATVFRVTRADRGKGAFPNIPQVGNGDAMVTDTTNVPISILVADCIPIFLVDPHNRAIGLAHAGWRGTVGGIVAETIRRMHECFNTDPGDILVWMGPGIDRCCFEVGPEVMAQFQESFPGWELYWLDRSGNINLKEINRRIALVEGVRPENIEISGDCTCCGEGYFSYRRDGARTGHNLCALTIVE